MRGFGRALVIGVLCGALAVIIFREGTLWLLHHAAEVMPPAAMVTRTSPYGVPWLAYFVGLGAIGGFLIALFLRLVPVPDLITGALLGLLAGHLVPQYLPAGTPDWVPYLVGAAWGWGTVFLARPLSLRARL